MQLPCALTDVAAEAPHSEAGLPRWRTAGPAHATLDSDSMRDCNSTPSEKAGPSVRGALTHEVAVHWSTARQGARRRYQAPGAFHQGRYHNIMIAQGLSETYQVRRNSLGGKSPFPGGGGTGWPCE